jgi:hypothetical protein
MFNRIEKTLALRALVLAGVVMGSASTSFAAAPAHMASKDAQASAAKAYSFQRGRDYLGQDPDARVRAQLLRDAPINRL